MSSAEIVVSHGQSLDVGQRFLGGNRVAVADGGPRLREGRPAAGHRLDQLTFQNVDLSLGPQPHVVVGHLQGRFGFDSRHERTPSQDGRAAMHFDAHDRMLRIDGNRHVAPTIG